MFTQCVSVFALCLTAGILSAQELTPDEQREGFFPLTTGKDFSGWRFSGTVPTKDKSKGKPFTTVLDVFPENWKAGDGGIQLLKGGNPSLGSQWDFDDFDVRLEWKAHKKSYNSGFYVRSGFNVGANQINLNQPAVGELINTAPALKEKAKEIAKGVPHLHKEGGNGEWNTWRVLAVGDKLSFWVNGQKAWDIDGFVPARGYLGIQAEGTIDFKNIRIKEMGYDLYRDPQKLGGTGWNAEGNVLSGKGKLTVPKSYDKYTLRIEFRGNGSLQLGDKTLSLASLKGLHPADQFNYLQVKAAGGKGKVWLNSQELKETVDVGAGPIAVVADDGLAIRNLRIRAD